MCRDVVPPILLDDSNCQQKLRLRRPFPGLTGMKRGRPWVVISLVVLKVLYMYLTSLGFMVMKFLLFACVI